jgi:uncharacterized protein YceK
MRKLVILLILLICSGCASASIKTTTAEGKLCEAYYVSFFKDISEASMSACGAKGGASGSQVNTAILDAFLQALMAVPK